ALIASARRKKASQRTEQETKAFRKYQSAKQHQTRARKGARKGVIDGSYDSNTEPTKAEAKEILTARGLKNPHVIDVCYHVALSAAERTGITPNRFLFRNGIAKTLASYAQKSSQTLEAVPDESVTGELSNRFVWDG